MTFEIAVLPGDGIGPEVVAEGVKVLKAVAHRRGIALNLHHDDVGGAAIDRYGTSLRTETLECCRKCHAVLFGAVGGPKWAYTRADVNPEQSILALRKGLKLFANLRHVRVFPELADSSPVKRDVVLGVDIMVVRELTGGIYFARPKRCWQTARGTWAVDTSRYTQQEVERILRVGFELARGRQRRLVSVDKANALETSRLWRETANRLAADYPDVTLEHVLVDSFAMQLIQRPQRFDTVVTENLFGDILTDEAAVLAGSLGMVPSASLASTPAPGKHTFGLYEPIHGSAPDIAGKGVANPIATILSVAMLLRYSLALPDEAQAVEAAVARVLAEGHRTADITTAGSKALTTSQMGDAVVAALG